MARHKKVERDRVAGETRQLLLDAATEEFAREGYVGANINRISQMAGFAKGTVYNYFPSKQALMLALIDQVAAAHVQFVSRRVRAESNAEARLRCFFEAGFAFVTQHLAQARVMIITLYGPHEDFKQHLFEAYQPLFQLVEHEILQAGMADGSMRPADPAATAVLLMTIYLGTGSQVSSDGDTWLDPQRVADFSWHALCRLPSQPGEEELT